MHCKGKWKEGVRYTTTFWEKKGVIVRLWSLFLQKVLAFSARALVLFPTASFLGPYSIFNLVDVAVPTARAQRHCSNSTDSKGAPTLETTQYLHVSHC